MSNRIQLLGEARKAQDRGSDFCTKNELMNAVLNTYGPVSILLKEMMARQQALEDHVGFVYVPPVEPDAAAPGDLRPGDGLHIKHDDTADGAAGIDGGDPE